MTDHSTSRPQNHRLQGLRGIAVIAVLIFHLEPSWLPGGFLGVDVFFVLSGFLIGGMLCRSLQDHGRINVLDFYKRRFTRIVPAALVVALLAFPLSYFVLLPSDMRDFSASMVGAVTLTLNKMVANNIGYFSPLAETQPLLHYWSLIVELHFYLLIPWIFSVFKHRTRWLIASLLLLSVVSLLYSNYLSFEDPRNNYYLLPSRAWELLLGVITFILFQTFFKNHFTYSSLGPLFLVIVLGCFLLFNPTVNHPSFISLVPVLSSCFLIVCLMSQTERASMQWLGSPIFVFIGNISFSLYLWHNVLVVILKSSGALDQIYLTLFVALGSVLLAFITWVLVEKPFMGQGMFSLSQMTVSTAYAATLVSCICLGVWGYFSLGFESNWLARQSANVARAYVLSSEASEYESVDHASECSFRENQFTDDLKNRVEACFTKYGKGTLVFGDSHAIGFWRLLNYSASVTSRDSPFVVGISRGGCKPYQERQGCSYQRLIAESEWLRQNFSHLTYVQAGSSLLGSDAEFRVHEKSIAKVLSYLKILNQSVNVSWIGPRIEPNINPRSFIADGCDRKQAVDEDHQNKLIVLNKYLQKAVNDSDVSFVDGRGFDIPQYSSCEFLFWRDENHWSAAGIHYLSEKIDTSRYLR